MANTIYQVNELNAYVKQLFDRDYALRNISVRGEVSNCKYNSSGHIYFTLKDETAAISTVMFAGNVARGLTFRLENGQKIIVNGYVSMYEKTGTYQLYATSIVLDGIGDLFIKYEENKKRFKEMGMFSELYKKPIPKYATKIGVVTASTGAAIQDIINVSSRRNPYVQLYLYPAAVQGEYAAPSIVKAINHLDKMGLDVIIVGRGGGSIEDLWAFSEEMVVTAIFDANTPIISAVGHETDNMLSDYVADLRAPTPSAAAEIAVFKIDDYFADIEYYKEALDNRIRKDIQGRRLRLESFKSEIERRSPKSKFERLAQKLDADSKTLDFLMKKKMSDSRNKLSLFGSMIEKHSPLAKLSGGYGFLQDEDGKPVKSIKNIRKDDKLKVYVVDGAIDAVVTDTEEKAN